MLDQIELAVPGGLEVAEERIKPSLAIASRQTTREKVGRLSAMLDFRLTIGCTAGLTELDPNVSLCKQKKPPW